MIINQLELEKEREAVLEAIKSTDNEIYELIKLEEKRQFDKIRLIASENYVSSAVLQATWSIIC